MSNLIACLVVILSFPAHSSLISSESGWDYNDYKATWSNTQNTNVGSVLGESGSPFVMWQSFATKEWMKYVLSFTYLANMSGYNDVQLRVTVFDGESSNFVTLLDESLAISESMRLLTYDAMFQAMSGTSVVRFSLSGNQPPTNSTSNTNSSLNVDINEVVITEVSAPQSFLLIMMSIIGFFVRNRISSK